MKSKQQREKRNESYERKMEAAYLRCIELERQREAHHRLNTKQGQFDAAMERLDAIQATDKFRGACSLGLVLSDPNKMRSLAERRKEQLDCACRLLSRHRKRRLSRVMRLIAKNGSNWKESVWELAKDYGKKRIKSTNVTARKSARFSASRADNLKKIKKVGKCL